MIILYKNLHSWNVVLLVKLYHIALTPSYPHTLTLSHTHR